MDVKEKSYQNVNGKKWTVMVYLAGSNNLVEEMVFAVRELRGKATTKIVNVFVEFDTGSDVWRFPPSAFEAKPNEDPDRIENIDLEKLGKKQRYPPLLNTRGILRRFVTEVMSASPDTEHYALILSGHGSGAVGDFLTGSTPGLTIPALGSTFDRVKEELAKGGHSRGGNGVKLFDILGLDSCTMSMAEIGYEVEGHVHHMIGAEGFELNAGWPYDRLIRLDLRKPVPELVLDIVQTYCDYYFNYSIGDLSTDQSAINLDRFSDILKPVVRKLAEALSNGLNDQSARDRILMAHWYAQSYKTEQYTDLWDFCNELTKRFPEGDDILTAAAQVQKAIEGVVTLSTYSGARFQHSHGIAIFFPWADIVDSKGGHDLSAYKRLKFANQTKWADFLKHYFERTKRLPRQGEGEKRTSHLNARPGIFGSLAEVKGGGAEDSKGTEDSQGFFPDEAKGGGSEDSKGGGAEDSKSGLFLPNLKIGQMKNPPTDWFRLDLTKERGRNAG